MVEERFYMLHFRGSVRSLLCAARFCIRRLSCLLLGGIVLQSIVLLCSRSEGVFRWEVRLGPQSPPEPCMYLGRCVLLD